MYERLKATVCRIIKELQVRTTSAWSKWEDLHSKYNMNPTFDWRLSKAAKTYKSNSEDVASAKAAHHMQRARILAQNSFLEHIALEAGGVDVTVRTPTSEGPTMSHDAGHFRERIPSSSCGNRTSGHSRTCALHESDSIDLHSGLHIDTLRGHVLDVGRRELHDQHELGAHQDVGSAVGAKGLDKLGVGLGVVRRGQYAHSVHELGVALDTRVKCNTVCAFGSLHWPRT